jgi:hypothetical protein
MKRLSCVLAVLVAAQLVAAPAPPEKKEIDPMEIDFTPLAKATAANFKMNFAVTSHDNTRTPMVCNLPGGAAPADIALLVKTSLPQGWDVVQDDDKLVIKSFKGSPIKSVEITLDGEKKELTPTVKRLKPEDKKEDK